MSTRAALVYVLIGFGLVAYVGIHFATARTLEVNVTGFETKDTYSRRAGRGTAKIVITDKGSFSFLDLPVLTDADAMRRSIQSGYRARIRVIEWLHGPLIEYVLGRPSRPDIIAVETY